MATVTTPTPGPSVPAPADDDCPRPFPMTVELYDRLVDSGVFGDRSPVYLWEGGLVLPMTKGPNHENAQAGLLAALAPVVRAGYHLRPGCPVGVTDHSKPEPDVAVVRGAPRDYKGRHPGPADVALVAEVSDSSLKFDTGAKLRAYAAAAVPSYWVVNLPEARVEVYADPTGPAERPGYRSRHDFRAGDEIPVVLDGREVGHVAVAEILP